MVMTMELCYHLCPVDREREGHCPSPKVQLLLSPALLQPLVILGNAQVYRKQEID